MRKSEYVTERPIAISNTMFQLQVHSFSQRPQHCKVLRRSFSFKLISTGKWTKGIIPHSCSGSCLLNLAIHQFKLFPVDPIYFNAYCLYLITTDKGNKVSGKILWWDQLVQKLKLHCTSGNSHWAQKESQSMKMNSVALSLSRDFCYFKQ